MSPASKKEWTTVRECKIKIEHLENEIKELKQEFRELRRAKAEKEQKISDRRLVTYLVLASIAGGIIVKAFEWIIG